MASIILAIIVFSNAGVLVVLGLLLKEAAAVNQAYADKHGLEAQWGGIGIADPHAGEVWDYDPTGEYTYKRDNPRFQSLTICNEGLARVICTSDLTTGVL